jgi:membrane protease YdiL (CAAX protease family)
VEFLAVFIALPTILAMTRLGRLIIPLAVTAAACCTIVLLMDRGFDRRWLWRGDSENRSIRPHLARVGTMFLIAAIGLALATYLYAPDHLFELPRENTKLWVIVMCFYPVLSVYPQEVVYRAFIFRRYSEVFPHSWFAPALSAIAFGYAHVLMKNPVAVLLSLLGGVLFAWTYHRTHSLLLVWLEHALYGCFIFTIGLGYYFYSGNVEAPMIP